MLTRSRLLSFTTLGVALSLLLLSQASLASNSFGEADDSSLPRENGSEQSTTADESIQASHKPDLVLENSKVDTESIEVGRAIMVRWIVKNDGAAVESSTTTIFLAGGPNSIPPMEIGGSPDHPHSNGLLPRGISTHEHGTPNLKIPNGVTPGTYDLILWVDAKNQVEESNENDNRQVLRITILP